MKKWVLGMVVGTTTAVAGAGIATGVILPKTLELKHGLENFVPHKGSAAWATNHWESTAKKLNYVALGDSETAGYNGFMHDTTAGSGGTVNGKPVSMEDRLSKPANGFRGGDYISYADFLANDLKNANKLATYHNFAESGATIAQQQELFLENAQIHETLKKADLITITIGANDLLAFVKILDLPFDSDIFKLIMDAMTGKVEVAAASNAVRDAIVSDDAPGQASAVNAGKTSEEVKKLAVSSIQKLMKMARTKDYSHIIDIAADFKDIIFDALYRNLMLFIHDLHTAEVAPNAQILILGHAMPFEQWDTKVLDAKRPDLRNRSIRTMFEELINSMNRAANFSLTKSSDYSGFLSVDDIKVKKAFSTSDEATAAGWKNKNSGKFTDFIKRDNTKKDFYIGNAMPNAADIHPSTFGHQLIGNGIFDYLAPHLGLNTTDVTSMYTYSRRYHNGDENHFIENARKFTAFDEKPTLSHSSADMLKNILSGADIAEVIKIILHGASGDGMIGTLLTRFTAPVEMALDAHKNASEMLDLLVPILGGDPPTAADVNDHLLHLKPVVDEIEKKRLANIAHQRAIAGDKTKLHEQSVAAAELKDIILAENIISFVASLSAITTTQHGSELLPLLSSLMGGTGVDKDKLPAALTALASVKAELESLSLPGFTTKMIPDSKKETHLTPKEYAIGLVDGIKGIFTSIAGTGPEGNHATSRAGIVYVMNVMSGFGVPGVDYWADLVQLPAEILANIPQNTPAGARRGLIAHYNHVVEYSKRDLVASTAPLNLDKNDPKAVEALEKGWLAHRDTFRSLAIGLLVDDVEELPLMAVLENSAKTDHAIAKQLMDMLDLHVKDLIKNFELVKGAPASKAELSAISIMALTQQRYDNEGTFMDFTLYPIMTLLRTKIFNISITG